jgi:hypothetical protein
LHKSEPVKLHSFLFGEPGNFVEEFFFDKTAQVFFIFGTLIWHICAFLLNDLADNLTANTKMVFCVSTKVKVTLWDCFQGVTSCWQG